MSQSTWFHPGLALLLFAAGCSGADDSDLFDGDPATNSGGTSTSQGTNTSSTDGGTDSTATTTLTTASATSDGSSTTSSGGSGGSATNSSSTTGAAGQGAGAAASSGGAGGSGGSGGSGASGSGGTGTAGSGGDEVATTGSVECTPSDEVCDGLDNDCNGDADEGEACPEDCTGASFDGHAYVFCVTPEGQQGNNPERSWSWAAEYCSTRDQVLVRVDSAEENAFIYEQLSAMSGSGDVWMAATDQEDEDLWVWLQGEDDDEAVPFYDAEEEEPIDDAFNDWAEGEPDNGPGSANCGVFEELDGGAWGWADRNCDDTYSRVVCEDP